MPAHDVVVPEAGAFEPYTADSVITALKHARDASPPKWSSYSVVDPVGVRDEINEAVVRRFERAVAASPQIVRCLSTTGQADYILTVLVEDIKAYEQCLHETIFKLPGVTHVRSSIVLREVKSDAALPIVAAAGEGVVRKRAARR